MQSFRNTLNLAVQSGFDKLQHGLESAVLRGEVSTVREVADLRSRVERPQAGSSKTARTRLSAGLFSVYADNSFDDRSVKNRACWSSECRIYMICDHANPSGVEKEVYFNN
jgi:hypothetical protein